MLGRGLDIFQRMPDSPFDLAMKHQRYRELRAFGITYLRDSVHGRAPSPPGRRLAGVSGTAAPLAGQAPAQWGARPPCRPGSCFPLRR